MRWLLLPLSALVLSSCDRVSQRIWNCSPEPMLVTKVLDTGARVKATIAVRNYVASMGSGVQIDALEQGGRVIWKSKRNLWVREFYRGLAASADEACGGGEKVIVAEEF